MNAASLTRCTFPTTYVRRFPDPNWNSSAQKIEHWLVVIRAKDLPKLPLDPNPRAQNLDKRVYKVVAESLRSETDLSFHLKNKGITIIAKEAKFNEDEKSFDVWFEDGQGIVDGGHTYVIIRENREACPPDQYVKLEILTGVPEDMIEWIARGLNTSVQVTEMSLANLDKEFDWIKEEIKGTRYEKKIAFKENEEGDYDARDLVALMTLFNIGQFKDGTTHPIIAYRNKAKCLELFRDDPSHYRRLRPLLKDILELHDCIQWRGTDLTNEVRRSQGEGSRAGGFSWLEYRSKKKPYVLTFTGLESDVKFVDGALYPMLGAFRYLVEQKKGANGYSWKVGSIGEVKKMFERVGAQMMMATQAVSVISGRNPSVIGKNSGHWDNLYKTVGMAYLEERRN